MSCDHVIEHLPWLLNGTLEEVERREVEAHLAGCEACRQALRETRSAWEVYDQHVPAAALVAHAFGEPVEGVAPELLERHLESCPRCAAELELARTSHRLGEEDRVVLMPAAGRQGRGRAGTFWRSSALAAGLVGLVAISGWVSTWQRAQSLEERVAEARPAAVDPRAAEVERRLAEARAQSEQSAAQVAELEQQVAELREQIAEATPAPAPAGRPLPRLNVALEDFYSSGDVLRGEDDGERQEISLQHGGMVLLHAKKDPTHVEILDAGDRVVWTGQGLALRPGEDFYRLEIPADFLPAGDATIRTYRLENGQKVGVESFPFRVR